MLLKAAASKPHIDTSCRGAEVAHTQSNPAVFASADPLGSSSATANTSDSSAAFMPDLP